MERLPQAELDLALSLVPADSDPPEPLGFFLCTYCNRKFYSSQALGGHQNAHRYQRTLAKRRREIAAVMRTQGESSSSVVAAWVDGAAAAAATRTGCPGPVSVAAGAEPDRATRPREVQQAVLAPEQPSSSRLLLRDRKSSSVYGAERPGDLDLSLRL